MKPMPGYRRMINGGIGVLFLWMAVIQVNDPDPIFWVAIYGWVWLIAVTALFNRLNEAMILLGICVCIGGALYLAPSVFTWLSENDFGDIVTGMSVERPYIEEARECIGLLMAAAALFYLKSQAKTMKAVFK
jgi:hypothetical protein